MATDPRAAILNAIRAANRATTTLPQAAQAWQGIPRPYAQCSPLSHDETVDLFVDRVHDYGVVVYREAAQTVAARLSALLEEHALNHVLIADNFPANLLPDSPRPTLDTGLSPPELNRYDAALTTCSVAIAETGTLVLQGGSGMGRRAMSLVPEVHLCVVDVRAIVASVPEAWARLSGASRSPLTFISGPSATSDIEMTRIQGVHGPRHLFIILYL